MHFSLLLTWLCPAWTGGPALRTGTSRPARGRLTSWTSLLACVLVLVQLTGVSEGRWLAGSGWRGQGQGQGQGQGRAGRPPARAPGGPRPWRTADPGVRARAVCPTRRCRCQRRLGQWHMHCTLPLSRLPRLLNPANITMETATIARRNLTKFPNGGFRLLPVRHLDLTGNLLISGLQGGALRGLGASLRGLSLAGCHLPKVPVAALREAPSLRALHLEYNAIERLRAGSFRSNSDLRDLSLYNNHIRVVDRGAFQGLGQLDKLRLSHNLLKELQRKMFRGAGNLTSLDVSDNLVTRIGLGAFRDLRQLKWLELGGNAISHLSGKMLRGLHNLKYLKLDRNPLLRIEDYTFSSSRRLRYLSFDMRNLTSLTNSTLAGLEQLKTFYIGEVGRDRFPNGVFGETVRLKFLSLSDYAHRFLGLTHRHFGDGLNLRQLSVWVQPVHNCTCHVTWIQDMTVRGAYIHGYCAGGSPISCRRRHRRKGRRRGKEE